MKIIGLKEVRVDFNNTYSDSVVVNYSVSSFKSTCPQLIAQLLSQRMKR
jgi:hypothetical protein